MRYTHVFGLSLAVALASSPAFAPAAKSDALSGSGPVPEVADKTLGTAVSGAVLNDGVINSLFSAGLVSSSRTGTGSYTATFNRNLYGCIPVIMAFTANRTATVGGPTGTGDDTWTIQTRDLAGALADSDVTIINFCAH